MKGFISFLVGLLLEVWLGRWWRFWSPLHLALNCVVRSRIGRSACRRTLKRRPQLDGQSWSSS